LDINPKIFREYDIRGIVGQDLDETVVETLGRAMGTFFLGRGQKDVAVGQDCRLSSPGFGRALIRGLLATGCDVADLVWSRRRSSTFPCSSKRKRPAS